MVQWDGEPTTRGATNAESLADVPWWSISRGSAGIYLLKVKGDRP